MERCDICGKDDIKSVQGLRSHERIVHPDSDSAARPPSGGESSRPDPEDRLLEVIGELSRRIEALEAVGEERRPESAEAAIARLRPALNEWLRARGAHPGLCADESCSPCRSARAEVAHRSAQEGREQFAGELEAAATWAGRRVVAEDLAQCHSDWVAAGRPAAGEDGPSDRNAKSSARRVIRVIRR